MLELMRKELRIYASEERRLTNLRFFKTGIGDYGDGDVFIGVRVPDIRKVAKGFCHIEHSLVLKLLSSAIHEERQLALFILVHQFKKADEAGRKKIFTAYMKNTRYINNWDLVDLSAPHIVGNFLFDKDDANDFLCKQAKSRDLWKKRIAIVSTQHFIRLNEFEPTILVAKILLNDEHDLIHKAVEWMLREVGKRDQKVAEAFLKKHYRTMPRTMLRYAIERFPETKRLAYLEGAVSWPQRSFLK